MSETQVLPPVQEGGKRWKAVMGIMTAFLLVLAVAAIAIVGNTERSRSPEAAAAAQSGDSQSGEAECPAQFVQTKTNHENGRVDSDFSEKYESMKASAVSLSDGQRDLVLKSTSEDAWTLAAWGYSIGVYGDPNEWRALQSADGKCLSEAGQDVWEKFDRALSNSDTLFEEAQAPSSGTNTGYDDGKFVVAAQPGINGDRKAIKITFQGWSLYIMVRCGNPVFPSAPEGVPVGKTDNPTKPPKSTTPKTCPPGQVFNDNGACVVPKSNNVQEYQAPGRDKTTDSGTGVKPAVPEVSTPAQTSPPRVETQRTGGGGVVDTPTKKPGSETGVTAPGASTPAPARTAVPSPEPSVNPAPAPGSTEPPVNTGDPGNPFD